MADILTAFLLGIIYKYYLIGGEVSSININLPAKNICFQSVSILKFCFVMQSEISIFSAGSFELGYNQDTRTGTAASPEGYLNSMTLEPSFFVFFFYPTSTGGWNRA